MSNHSRRSVIGQDVVCTAIGCKRDVDKRFYPSMTCQFHAVLLHSAVEAHRDFIQGMARNMYAAEAKPVKQIPKKYVVYYIQFGHGIKIGTTHNLAQRLQQFCLPPSSVLAVEPGGFDLERSRHEFFKDTRVGRSEVFTDSPKIRRHIEAVLRYHGEPKIKALAVEA